jgi:alanine-glyoxylate transaminase/serine-glyoxylate transaminase/serine-pyruvate transaminase
VDEAWVRKQLLQQFQIEIGGGLGSLKGAIWRIGLMGASSTRNNVYLFLSALESCLLAQAFKLQPGAAIAAASQIYTASEG